MHLHKIQKKKIQKNRTKKKNNKQYNKQAKGKERAKETNREQQDHNSSLSNYNAKYPIILTINYKVNGMCFFTCDQL